MITDIAQQLLASFNGEDSAVTDLFVNSNQTVSGILDLICTNSKLFCADATNAFSREDLRPIAKNFLLHRNTNLFHKTYYKGPESLTTDFLIDNTGRMHFVLPNLSFFAASLRTYDKDHLKKFYRKVLKPYSKQISKGKPLSESFLQSLQTNIEEIFPPRKDDSNLNEIYSSYIIDSILANPEFITKTIQSTESKPFANRLFRRSSKSNAIFQSLNQYFMNGEFKKTTFPAYFSSVKQLFYTTQATLSALSMDLHSLSPEALEQYLISLNDTLLLETGKSTRYYKPGQYREQPVEVGLKSLVLNGDKGFVEGVDPQCEERISKAMKPLSSDIISLAQNSDSMSLDDYIKQVALIHFRYINIHPFSDGNGRTGRLITNMLMKQKGMLFNIESREAKDEYIQVMNAVEHGVLQHIGPSEYLANLYQNPAANKDAEEASISGLASFIATHSKVPGMPNKTTKSKTPELEYIIPDPDLYPDLSQG